MSTTEEVPQMWAFSTKMFQTHKRILVALMQHLLMISGLGSLLSSKSQNLKISMIVRRGQSENLQKHHPNQL
jgi:hypothetical protein